MSDTAFYLVRCARPFPVFFIIISEDGYSYSPGFVV
jgi:hypothetical protein